jgi:hypothetical protein
MVERRTMYRGRVRAGSAASTFLAIAAALATVACLDDPPEYTRPTRIPPVVNSLRTYPPPTSVYVIAPTETSVINFDIPFRSEDVGTPLQAIFVLDFEATATSEDLDKVYTPRVDVDSSDVPFEEQTDRSVVFPWSYENKRPAPGCHSLTMILNYVDNFAGFYTPDDDSLATLETWWFYFVPLGSDEVVVECPQR